MYFEEKATKIMKIGISVREYKLNYFEWLL